MSDKKTKPAGKGAASKTPSKAPAASKKSAQKVEVPKAPAAFVAATSEVHKRHSFRRTMIGLVTGDKMNKTVVVEVIRKAMDPVYKKYVRMRERYKAHDEHNQFKIGDRVEITEHRPISRDKRWLVTKLIARRVEE